MNPGNYETLIVSREGDVTTIRFNRPQRYNSFVQAMAFEVQGALDRASADGTRCILLRGEGKAFSAGEDLNEVTDPAGPPMHRIVSDHFNPIVRRIREIELPIVAAVNGTAAGAGANIALACDIVVAKTSAYFLQAFSSIGLIPDSGGTYHLPRLIGWQRASALIMLDEKVSAQQAETMGMIYKAVPDEEFESYVHQLTHRLASLPTRGLGLAKRALNLSLTATLHEQLKFEEQLQTAAGKTTDYKEGVQAFLEKRKANFTGK